MNRVDWKAVLLALRVQGQATTVVAQRLGIPRGTVMGWLNNGAEPKHCDGEALIAVWEEVTQQPREALPYAAPRCRETDTQPASFVGCSAHH